MSEFIKRQILIDTDLGDDVDDAAALIMALNSPELDIIGITTVYQDTLARAEMVSELCGMYGRPDIPVCPGFGLPLIERPDMTAKPVQYDILSQKRPVPRECDGAEFILQAVREHPDVTIVAMGAMTNLAAAFHRAPDVMKSVPILAMGGVFDSSLPEWNIKCDPEAARIVTDLSGHLTMFGLDVTKYCRIENALLDEICLPENENLQYFMQGVKIFQKDMGYPVTLHDALLIAYLLDPAVVELGQGDFTVELSGSSTRGAMVSQMNPYEIEPACKKNFYYARKIHAERFREMVRERLR